MNEFFKLVGHFVFRDISFMMGGLIVVLAGYWPSAVLPSIETIEQFEKVPITLVFLALPVLWLIGFLTQTCAYALRLVEVRRPKNPDWLARACYRIWERARWVNWDNESPEEFDSEATEVEVFRQEEGRSIGEYQRIIFLKQVCATCGPSLLIFSVAHYARHGCVVLSACILAVAVWTMLMSRVLSAIQVSWLIKYNRHSSQKEQLGQSATDSE